jgi:hypothetical protein
MAFLDQHRRGAGGIEQQEGLAPLPHPFLNQAHRHAVFAHHETDETRMRTERVMEQQRGDRAGHRGRLRMGEDRLLGHDSPYRKARRIGQPAH